MKTGWQKKSLRDVCVIDKCQGIHKQLPYVGLEDIESHTGRFIGSTSPCAVKSSSFKFSPQHLLYGRLRPYLNKVLAPGFDGHCSTEIFPLKPSATLSRKFLQYWFFSDTTVARIDATCTGARMPRANMKVVLDFEFSLPPLPDQQRIVGILDKAFDGIATAKANAEKNLQNARALFRSAFGGLTSDSEQAHWSRMTVAQLASPKKGAIRTGPFGSQLLHSEFVDEGVAVLGIDNAVANEFRWGKSRLITPEKYHQLQRYRVYPGDVLITIMGTCGRCAIVPDDIPIAINSKHLCCITLDPSKCFPGYLHAYFLYHPLSQEFLGKHAKGAIMAGLNMRLIQELPVLLPPLKRQREIVASLNSLKAETKRLESIYQKKLAALDALKKSLLHQAFSGAL